MFADWRHGVLVGISAPDDAVNSDTLWAWGRAESGLDVMRWNNPLNTTEELQAGADIDPDMNRVGVEAYPNWQDGVIATVATLLNGRYPVIVGHLRNSVPRSQWADACGNLGTWGTGCGWLNLNYGTAPGILGGNDVLSDADLTLIHDELQFALWGVIDTSAKSRSDFLFAVKQGQSIGSIVQGWTSNPQHGKWQEQLATIGQPQATTEQQVILAAIAKDQTTDESILNALATVNDSLVGLSGKIDSVFVRPSATPGP